MSNLNKKLAQIFPVAGEFSPTKASVYLRTQFYDNNNYLDLSQENVIDSANFLNLTSANQRIFLSDEDVDISGVGSLLYPTSLYSSSSESDFNTINYPIKGSGNHTLWVRLKKNPTTTFNIRILIDNVSVGTISDTLGSTWEWKELSGGFTLSDEDIHTLGIRLYSNGIEYDQLALNPDVNPTGSSAKEFTNSPYITVHSQIYEVNEDFTPNTPLYIHDYKNTINHINKDGWYNFDTNFIDNSGSITFSDDYYALVLAASGSRSHNNVFWEQIDADEVYEVLPIAKKG